MRNVIQQIYNMCNAETLVFLTYPNDTQQNAEGEQNEDLFVRDAFGTGVMSDIWKMDILSLIPDKFWRIEKSKLGSRRFTLGDMILACMEERDNQLPGQEKRQGEESEHEREETAQIEEKKTRKNRHKLERREVVNPDYVDVSPEGSSEENSGDEKL